MDVGTEVLEGVNADDRVELLISEWQVASVGIYCRHPVSHSRCVEDGLRFLRRHPEVAGHHLDVTLAGKEDRGRAAPGTVCL